MDISSISKSIPFESIPLGSIITGISTLAGVLIVNYFNEKRWYLDHLLKSKIDRLLQLHLALTDCFYKINHHINTPPQNILEYEELDRKINNFLKEATLTEPYLNVSGRDLLRDVRALFQIAEREILLHLPGDIEIKNLKMDSYIELDYERFISSFHAICEHIFNVVNPPLLKNFEKKILGNRS